MQNTIDLIEKYQPQCVHCFLPIHSKAEIDTSPIIQYCWKHNINIVVPVSNFEDGTLKNAEFRLRQKQNKQKIILPNPLIRFGEITIVLI